jgi:hypothetical protein
MRKLGSWYEAPFDVTQISGWTVVTVCFLPWLLFPLLPESDFTMPVFATSWFMGASGVVGVYLLDATRRPVPAGSWARTFQVGARTVLVVLGLLGSVAGGTILYGVSTTIHLLPLRSLLVGVVLGSAAVYLGIAVTRWGLLPVGGAGKHAA